jgi:hypothetical protein
VDERVERGVADQVVGDVDEEPLVGRDGRGERVEDVGEGREGAVAELVAWEKPLDG